MRTKALLNWSEGEVDLILERQLEGTPYRAFASVRVSDVIAKDRGDHLPQGEWRQFRSGHFDFLVTLRVPRVLPVFALEFDGPHHLTDKEQMKRDIVKNRLCRKASLPLLRIRCEEIERHDKTTVLDYMISRFLAWPTEEEAIYEEIGQTLRDLGPDEAKRRIEDCDPSVDPGFLFDLRHPFPLTQILKERLWREHSIAHIDTQRAYLPAARFKSGIVWSYLGPDDQDECFHKCAYRIVVRPAGDGEQEPVFESEVFASVRAWLRTDDEVPSAGDLLPLASARTVEEIRDAVAALERRVQSMWFPDLPGIGVGDIAENFAEYLAYRAIEKWADSTVR